MFMLGVQFMHRSGQISQLPLEPTSVSSVLPRPSESI